jgi:hypothetical protein
MINAPIGGQRFWDIKFLEASSVDAAIALAREVAFNLMRSSPHLPEEFKFELFHSSSVLPRKIDWGKEFAEERRRDDAEERVARYSIGSFPSE